MARYDEDGYGYEEEEVPVLGHEPEDWYYNPPPEERPLDADFSDTQPAPRSEEPTSGGKQEDYSQAVLREDSGGGQNDSIWNPPVPPGTGGGSEPPRPTEAAFNPQDWLEDLSRRTHASINSNDAATLAGKNKEDLAAAMRAFEEQYGRRGSNSTSHRPFDSQTTDPWEMEQNRLADQGIFSKPGPRPVSPPTPQPRPGGNQTGTGGSAIGGNDFQDYLARIQALGSMFGGPGSPGVFGSPVQQVGQDPLSQAITGGYADLLSSFGQSPLAEDMDATLRGLIERGGRIDEDPATKAARFEAARQPIDSMRKAQTASLRGSLANRGLISEPGMPQGSEIGAVGRMEESLAPYYATAAQNLASADQQANDQRLSEAMQLAVGLSRQQAETFLSTLESATDRQRVLSEIALGTLDRNLLWNRFLAELGLERGSTLNAMQSGRIEELMPLLVLFQQYINSGLQGYI